MMTEARKLADAGDEAGCMTQGHGIEGPARKELNNPPAQLAGLKAPAVDVACSPSDLPALMAATLAGVDPGLLQQRAV